MTTRVVLPDKPKLGKKFIYACKITKGAAGFCSTLFIQYLRIGAFVGPAAGTLEFLLVGNYTTGNFHAIGNQHRLYG